MSAIKAKNSKYLKVVGCVFSGFDTDIELENVEGFISDNNQFSKSENPQLLINRLINSIKESGLDKCSQERLYIEIFTYLAKSHKSFGKEVAIKDKIVNFLGNKAADYFVQLTAAVSAGLLIQMK